MVSRKMLAPDVSAQDVENTQIIEASDSKLDKLPKILASTKKGTRHKGMQALGLWLTSREPSEEDLKKVWKGLFYAVWHADKAPVQEELINRVAGLMLNLSEESARRFLQIFLWTMRREWSGIDRLRLDKFYLLLRTFLRTTLEYLQKGRWAPRMVTAFTDVYSRGTLEVKDNHAALGVNLHFADTFLEEVGPFPVPPEAAPLLLEPFLRVLSHSVDKTLLPRVESAVFGALMDARKESDDMSSFTRALDFDQLASRLFALASAPETAPKNRAALYAVHARLKREGTEMLLQKGGEADEEGAVVEEPPVKENGKRAAPEEAIEKRKKKRKVEIVKIVETAGGGLEAVGLELQGENGREGKTKKGRKRAESEEAAHVSVSAPTAIGGEKSVKKGKKKRDRKGEVSEATGIDGSSLEPAETGTASLGEGKGTRKGRMRAEPVGLKGGVAEGETDEAALVSKKAGKRKAEVIVEAEAVGEEEATLADGEGAGKKKKARKSRKAGGEGGSEQRKGGPPAMPEANLVPDRKKLLKAALKRAAAEAEVERGAVEDAHRAGTVDLNGGAAVEKKMKGADVAVAAGGVAHPSPTEEISLESRGVKKARKGKENTGAAPADVADDVTAPGGSGSQSGKKKGRKTKEDKGAAAADVADDVTAPGASGSQSGKKKGRKAKAKEGGDASKADAIAALERALNELQSAGSGSPAVAQEKGRKKQRGKKSVVGDEAEPGTPEVVIEGVAGFGDGEAESAAKRRKSGAGATPAIAPKSATAPDGSRLGAIGKSGLGAAPLVATGGANLAGRFAEAGDGAKGRRKRKAGGDVKPSVEDAQDLNVSHDPEGKSVAAATTSGVNKSTPGSTGQKGGLASGPLKKKKVRFSLKNNLEFKFGSPLPEKTTRTPPAATPRGSALKVTGPSPIRKMGMSLVDGHVIGSRRDKKDRRGPVLVHIAGMRSQGGRVVGNRSPGRGRGQGRRSRQMR